MTDKQIIDGERMFKCVWCKYDFKESDANFILSENPNECVCSSCMTEWADNLLWDFKRKEQECEELKREIAFGNNGTLSDKIRAEVFKDLNNENSQLKAENEKLDTENKILVAELANPVFDSFEELDKLKQTLSEIKEIAEPYNDISGNCVIVNVFKDMCNILQKISEVE